MLTQGIGELERTLDGNLYLDGDRYHSLKVQPQLPCPHYHSLIFPVILTLLVCLLTCMAISNSHLPCQALGDFSAILLGWITPLSSQQIPTFFLFTSSLWPVKAICCLYIHQLQKTKVAELWSGLCYALPFHLQSLSS